MSLTLTRERIEETVIHYVYPRPITFDEWLETGDRERLTELISGTPVEKPMVQLEHEKLNLWLLHILAQYAMRTKIGTVLGTRSPIRINNFQGRMPDLFFVRKENEHLITARATLCAPDLIIEIISPNDRKADINATEADYQTIGVSEIVYIDLKRRRIRVLHKTDTNYTEETLSEQSLILQTMNHVTLEWAWLFEESRPDTIDTVLSLLQKNPVSQ
jgi:Uma2 family endonuclease